MLIRETALLATREIKHETNMFGSKQTEATVFRIMLMLWFHAGFNFCLHALRAVWLNRSIQCVFHQFLCDCPSFVNILGSDQIKLTSISGPKIMQTNRWSFSYETSKEKWKFEYKCFHDHDWYNANRVVQWNECYVRYIRWISYADRSTCFFHFFSIVV